MILTSSLAALALGAATVPPPAPAPVPAPVTQADTGAASPAAPAAPAKPDWLPKPKPWLDPGPAKPAPKFWADKL